MVRIITGSAIVLLGIWIFVTGLPEGIMPALAGIGFAVLGTIIILNKHEDDIEKINTDKK